MLDVELRVYPAKSLSEENHTPTRDKNNNFKFDKNKKLNKPRNCVLSRSEFPIAQAKHAISPYSRNGPPLESSIFIARFYCLSLAMYINRQLQRKIASRIREAFVLGPSG
ncbi:hypothetical protein CCP2SC5_140003 [Azospirillaceae bacterium]